MNKLDKVLIIIGIFIATFIIAMIVVFCIFQTVPDSLIAGVLGTGGAECLICGIIKISRMMISKEEDDDDAEI